MKYSSHAYFKAINKKKIILKKKKKIKDKIRKCFLYVFDGQKLTIIKDRARKSL